MDVLDFLDFFAEESFCLFHLFFDALGRLVCFVVLGLILIRHLTWGFRLVCVRFAASVHPHCSIHRGVSVDFIERILCLFDRWSMNFAPFVASLEMSSPSGASELLSSKSFCWSASKAVN